MNPEEHREQASREDDSASENGPSALPHAEVRTRRRLSPVWILPLLALGVTGYVVHDIIAAHGAGITLTFKTADGLRAGQTQVMYKAVPLGTVSEIELGKDADSVVVHVDMRASAEPLLTENARFWVVRPRLQAGALAALQTGLQTLVSGPYVELDPGVSRGAPRRHFTGLEEAPTLRSDASGTSFVLRTREVGSLGSGSVVLHRQVPVGEVLGIDIDEASGAVVVRVFVRAPHDRLVRPETCFWNASGLVLGMGGSGLRLELSSMRTLLSGGVAFLTPERFRAAPPARAGHAFDLYDTRAAAEVALGRETIPYVVYLHDSVLGLAPGSAVNMYGVQVGTVTELALVADPRPKRGSALAARVSFVLQPERALSNEARPLFGHEGIKQQVAHGLRVVLETSNFVTGEKALALAYLGAETPSSTRDEAGALVLPGTVRGLGALSESLSDLTSRLNTIPYERIGRSLDHALQSIDRAASDPALTRSIQRLASTLDEAHGLVREARAGLAPALARLPALSRDIEEAVGSANAALSSIADADGDFRRDTERMLTQVADMARSVRLLADYLERHPEALLRGRRTPTPP